MVCNRFSLVLIHVRPGGRPAALQIEDCLRHGGQSRKPKAQFSRFHQEAVRFVSEGKAEGHDEAQGELDGDTTAVKRQSSDTGGPTAAQCLTAVEVLRSGGSSHEYERRCLSNARTNPVLWPTGRSSRGMFYNILDAAAEAAFNVDRRRLQQSIRAVALAEEPSAKSSMCCGSE